MIEISANDVQLDSVHGGSSETLSADSVLILMSRLPNEELFLELDAKQKDIEAAGIKSVSRIGDCAAPSIIAAAVHSGSKWARALDQDDVVIPSHLPMPLAELNN